MFQTTSLPSLLLITVSLWGSVTATPPASLELIRHIKPRNGLNLADADRARATAMMGGSQARRASSFSISDMVTAYTANVGVGIPPTFYQLLIDTGSSNTWVGAGKAYRRTSTSKSTGQKVGVKYGSGFFSGTEFIDTVSLSPRLVINSQSIGVASNSSGFEGFDGIIGIGPIDLTNRTINNGSNILIPTVTDNLYKQRDITLDSVSIAFAPTTTNNANKTNGILTFGGIDSTRFIGNIEYVPITKTLSSGRFWGINQSVFYGSTPLVTNNAGVLDTGTTLLLLKTESFDAYANSTGAKMDNMTGLLELTKSQYQNLKTLNFRIGNRVYPMTQNAQLWPRPLNEIIGGKNNSIYLIVGDLGNVAGSGISFINGFCFLQRFYSIYDTTHSRIGLAFTPYTFTTSN